MAHDLPEPIPPRFPFGYLNDPVARDCFAADMFFTSTCRWCGAPMMKNAAGHYTCSGTVELASCDSAET